MEKIGRQQGSNPLPVDYINVVLLHICNGEATKISGTHFARLLQDQEEEGKTPTNEMNYFRLNIFSRENYKCTQTQLRNILSAVDWGF